jgi:hypothetical protein
MTTDQILKLGISGKGQRTTQGTFQDMVKRGWVTFSGRSTLWFEHQGPRHNEQFEEPKEPRSKDKKKFVKDSARQDSVR